MCADFVNSYDLPDDLFDKKAGEARPTKQVKPTKPAKKKLKRSFAEVDVSELWSHLVRRQQCIRNRRRTEGRSIIKP
jgi:hypothetical protein